MSAAAAFCLGIDLGGTKTEARLFDPQGVEVWRQRQPTPVGDYGSVVQLLAALVEQARAVGRGLNSQAALTVGMGTPGTMAAGGLMKNCNSTSLNGQPLKTDVESAIGQAIRVANDANCLALSEATDGAGAGAGVVFAAILGTGTGAGIAVRGRVLSGPNGLAGEWGHNPLPWRQEDQDPAFSCYCGQHHCIESLVSGPGLARDHAARHGGSLSAEAVTKVHWPVTPPASRAWTATPTGWRVRWPASSTCWTRT